MEEGEGVGVGVGVFESDGAVHAKPDEGEAAPYGHSAAQSLDVNDPEPGLPLMLVKHLGAQLQQVQSFVPSVGQITPPV